MSESSQSSSSLSPNTSPSSAPSPALSSLSLTDLKEVSDEDRQEAARLKADANKAFLGMLSELVACLLAENCVREGHDFPRAAQLYSTAIKHNPGDATLFCNRAYTRIKLEEHGYALHDAGKYQISSTCFEKLDPLP
jgi:serine/threonine-protein phosphatase 5